MLFYLTNTLIVTTDDETFQDVNFAIHNIANAVVNSNHLLLGDFEAIKHFRDIFKTDFILYPLFNKLYQNFAVESIPTYLTYYIEIVKDNPISRVEKNVEIHQMIYSDFSNSDYCVKSRLICECIDDGIFFRHILDWFISKFKNKISYACDDQNGGGNTTYKVVKKEVDNHHCTICIIDTDLRYPNDESKNTTYSKCKELKIEKPIYKLLPLQVHEIENLVPLNYIDSFNIWGQKNDAENMKAFKYLLSDAENILPYFDYKNGIIKNSLYNNNQELQKFSRYCYSLNINYTEDYDTFVGKLEKKGKIYPPLLGGSGIMTRIIEIIQSNSAPVPELLKFQIENWNEIGQNLLNWCITRNHESIH